MTLRSVLITGASRGIGRAIAERFSAAQFRVIAPARSEMDLSSRDSVEDYLNRSAGEEIDVLINNAGENRIAPIDSLSIEDFERVLTTNLTSALMLTKHFAPKMAARAWGRIVNISSCYSFLARPGRVAYSASKGALNSLTRTAALEFGTRNVLVNAVAPGFVETEMTRKNNGPEQIAALASQTALGRLAQPAEIAEVVFFLASEQNTYLTGQVVVVDGGFSCQ